MGEDVKDLLKLSECAFLESSDDFFWLTDSGKTLFVEAAKNCFLMDRPGDVPDDPERSIATTRLWLDLERGHVQRWGLKDYHFHWSFDTRPSFEKPLYSIDRGVFKWLYLDDPAFRETVEDFPVLEIRDRKLHGLSDAKLKDWRNRYGVNEKPLKADLLYLCRYDFEQYTDFRGYPGDDLNLVNADRFFFSFDSDLDTRLNTIGKYHLWLNELRRAAVPGFLDLDTQEQQSVNWILFVTEDEADAVSGAEELKTFGDELIRPVNPMEIWTISLEALESYPPKQDVIWELLPFTGHPVRRTLN